jgi:pyridoxine kinase
VKGEQYLIDNFKTKDNFVIIDPVMGDNGSLYVGFDQAFANSMAKLCSKADIIVPNLTEASFMLKEPYIEKDYDEDYIKQTLKKLTNLGAKKAVLTGVKLGNNQIGAYAYDSTTNSYFSYCREYLPESFHGTGDVFASTLCGGLTIKKTLYEALKIAVDYTVESIKITINSPDKNWYGVEFERYLYLLR